MDRLTVGGAVLDRIEETIDTSFTAEGFFPAFDPEVLRPHMPWLAPRYYIAERGALLLLEKETLAEADLAALRLRPVAESPSS